MGKSTVANVSGLPGFMHTRPKCTVPFRSSRGLIRSRSPMDTPPEVTRMSTPASMARCRQPSNRPARHRDVTKHNWLVHILTGQGGGK